MKSFFRFASLISNNFLGLTKYTPRNLEPRAGDVMIRTVKAKARSDTASALGAIRATAADISAMVVLLCPVVAMFATFWVL